MPRDRVASLLQALGEAADDASRVGARRELSRALVQEDKRDLVLAVWADQQGLEPEIWRGIVAALDPDGSGVDPLALLEHAHAEALRLGREDLVAIARTYLAKAYSMSGRNAEALSIAAVALAAAIERRDGWGVFRAAYVRCFTLGFGHGLDPRPAVQELERVADSLRLQDARIARMLDLGRAFILLHTEERRTGLRLLSEAIAEPPTTFAHDVYLRLRARILVAAQEGDADRAWQAYGEWQGWVRELGDHELLGQDQMLEAETALTLGDTERCRRALERTSRSSDRHRSSGDRLALRLVRAELLSLETETKGGPRRLRAAARARARAERFRRDGLAWFELRWRLVAGRLYARSRVIREARRNFERAASTGEQLDLACLADLARSALRGLARGLPGHAIPDLTERQEEIVALVARGATNRDISRQLCIAEATVARHVSNVLLRLDLADRHRLAEFYHRAVERRRAYTVSNHDAATTVQ